MANPVIKVKRSSVAGKVPAATQIERGELAINSYDGKVYIVRDQFSTGIGTTTHTVNPWDEYTIGSKIAYAGIASAQQFDGNITGSVNSSGVSTFSSASFTGDITGTGDFYLSDTGTNSSAGPIIDLYRNSSSAADADYLGQIKFQGENDADQKNVYAKITGKIQDASDGSEDGLIEFANTKAGSNVITARLRSDSLQLLNGTNFSVAGTSDFTGNVTCNGNFTIGDYSLPTSIGAEGLVLKVDGSGNLVFGSGSSGGVVPTEEVFTASQGQTVFTVSSALPTYVQVFVNGVKLRPTSDFSKSGSSVTLVSAATAGDEIDIVRFD